MAKNNEVGNPAKIKDLNDAIVLLNGQAVMHPKKRLAQTPAPKSKRSESASGDEPSRYASLTAPERETIILMNDEDSTASVSTHQRTIITKLKANPAAKLIKEGLHGKTAWAEFELPAALVSFRSAKKTSNLTPEQKAAAAQRLAAARAARSTRIST